MAAAEDSDIPETGAVFTFGKSKFADNLPNKFWVKNDRVTQVACGDEHTALIVESGRVFMFGLNDWGQLGLGQDIKPGINKPSCIKTLKHEKSKMVACGRSHTLISTDAGHIYSFGSNAEGQLGIADAPDQYTPRHIESLEATNYKMLTAGSDSSMALTEDGRLFVWGGNEDGKLGLGEDVQSASVPELLEFDHPVVCVACGYYHTAVVTDDGKLYTMGEADGGKLGLPKDVENTKVPNHVTTIPDPVKWVACGSSHTVALTEFGEIYVFGEGENGQLGLGTELLSTSAPTHLQLPFKVAWVFCGQDFTALISEKGQLYTFGDGRYGKLGHGSDQYSNLYKPNHCKRFCYFTVEKVACGGCHMIVTAKVKVHDGKIDSDDEPDELKSLSDTLSKSEESPSLTRSLSARERRRNELQKSYSSFSQTLPALTAFKGLSSLSATMPVLKSSKPKINGHPLNKTVVPKLNNMPNGKASHVNSSEESEDEEEEEENEQHKPRNQPTNPTLPVASPRRKPPQLQEQNHVEDGSDGDDENDSESENEARHKKEKHQDMSEEEKDEQNEMNSILELPAQLEAELDIDLELENADVQKENVPKLQLVDENANEKGEQTSDEVEELDEGVTTPTESPVQAHAPVATPRRKKESDVQHEEAKQADEDSGSDDRNLKHKDKEGKKDHKEKEKKKKKEDKDNDDNKVKKEKEKKKKNKKEDIEEDVEDEEEENDKKAKSKKDKKKKEKDKKKKKEDEDGEEEKGKKKEKAKKKDKNKEKIDDESKKKKNKKDDESEENEEEEKKNKKSKNKTEDQNKGKITEENHKDKKKKDKEKNGENIVAEKDPVKASPPKRSRLCAIL